MNKRVLLVCLLIPSLLSCTRKHDEKVISCTLPTSWKASLPEENATLSSDSLPKETIFAKTCVRWWEVYKNDDLNRLMETAFSGNFGLQTYFHRVEEVLADSGIVLADLYPQIVAFGSAERDRLPKSKRTKSTNMTGGSVELSPASPQPITPLPAQTATFVPSFTTTKGPKYHNDLRLGLQLSYEVDLWGKLSMHYAASKERLTESQEDYLAARLSLSADISDSFFRALYYTTQIQLEDVKLKALLELIGIERDRVRTGLASEDALLNYEQSKDETLSQKENLLRLRTQAENRLAYLAGMTPETFSPPSYGFSFHTPELPSHISSKVLLHRPDIASLSASVQASALDIESAQADILPSLIIGPNFPSLIVGPGIGYESNKANTLTKWKNHIWSLGASVSYDLFDGGRKTSQVHKNKALFLENLNHYQDRVLQAIKETEDALYALHESNITLKNQKNRWKEAQNSSFLSQSRFERGFASKIEYLQSVIDVCTKEEDVHQRELVYIQSSIQLFTAIGGVIET